MEIFDSHAHYDDARFSSEWDGGADAALRYSRSAGVMYVVNAGADLETSRASLRLAGSASDDMPRIFAAVGVHPTEVGRYASIEDVICELRSLASDPKAVAIGEIGLDYHYPDTDRDRQLLFFRAQYELARGLGLPVVIHDRDAHGDTFDVVREFRDVKTVLHSYSGSAEMAKVYADMGVYMSFGGVLTFKNAKKAREAAAVVPRELLMLETDAPYLAPTPHRGKINCSAYIAYTASVLGEIIGVGADEAALIAKENSERFFNIR